MNALLEGVKHEAPMSAIAMHHKHQVPPEYTWILHRGLMKDPDARFQSVPELASRIVKAMEGRNPVECPCTGLKRANGTWSRFIDRYPYTSLFLAAFATASALVGVGTMVAALF
ncbi:MAG: hypothetical protein U0325_06420 [Polyangiales bacterium]